jgi:hypothetical protein
LPRSSKKRVKEWLDGAIALRYAEQAARLRHQQGKDTGTVRFEDGDVTVVAELPKRIDWDQNALAEISEVATMGDRRRFGDMRRHSRSGSIGRAGTARGASRLVFRRRGRLHCVSSWRNAASSS